MILLGAIGNTGCFVETNIMCLREDYCPKDFKLLESDQIFR